MHQKLHIPHSPAERAASRPHSAPQVWPRRAQRRENRRTVVIRDPDTRRTREAEVDIYEPMLNYIEDNAFAEAMEIFMHHFETDLRGRVKARISV